MANLSNMLKGSPLSQMKQVASAGETLRLGDATQVADFSYSSNQRLVNQMNTAAQVQNYAAQKQMSEQSRTDMRGNVLGYSDTLG